MLISHFYIQHATFFLPSWYSPFSSAPEDPCGCGTCSKPPCDPCWCIETSCGCPPCSGQGCDECYCDEWPSVPETEAAHILGAYIRGRKRYELTNHLGNVLAVISDRKLQINSGGTVDTYNPDIWAYHDYYPFGMTMMERTWQAEGYRYGFQGQEADDEVFGEDNAINYTFRMHDARIGRFLSIDPLAAKYPFYSPYAFSGNRVIDSRELEGLERIPSTAELEDIESRARETVENGRNVGFDMAADNLELYLNGNGGDGAGGPKIESLSALRSHSEFSRGEERVLGHFMRHLMTHKNEILNLQEGGVFATDENEYFEAILIPHPLANPGLFYASHVSNIRATGVITVTKEGDLFEISGEISLRWTDTYDWDPNAGEYYVGIYPGVKVDDLELHLLGRYGSAKPFSMEATWNVDILGSFRSLTHDELMENRFQYIFEGQIPSFYGAYFTSGEVEFIDSSNE